MKLFTSISIIFILAFNLSAQNVATISGRIFDRQSHQPLPYATVVLKQKSDNSFISGTITNENGIFVLENISQGNYIIDISFIGYKNYTTEIHIGKLNTTYDLGKIEVEPDTKELGEIQVTAAREAISQTLEKRSFSIDENISQAGGSVLKVIQTLPGITVDPEGIVYLRGSDKVTILIDGKQSSLTGYGNQKGLDNIPASNIDRIEIITNPSAKYESKGMAGIINIIYRKEKQTGLSGEIGLASGIGEFTQRRENLPGLMRKYNFTPKITPNISVNYRTSKINLFLQSDGMVRKRVNTNEFILRNYADPLLKDIQSQFLENRTQQLYNIKAGFDWYINDNNTLTLYSLWQDEYHIDRGHVPYDDAVTGVRQRFWKWAEDEDTKFINFSASFSHKFIQPGHKLDIGYIFTGGGEDELFPFSDSSAIRVSDDQTHLYAMEYVHSFNLDYVKPLRSGRLEAGTKINLRHLPIEFYLKPGLNSVLDTRIGEYSDYYENVLALYLNYIYESPVIELEGGVRAEESFIKYIIDPANEYYDTNDKYNYFDLYPNIRFSLKINDKNRLTMFINRRIDRPGEFDLRPFPKYDDPEILKTGNPFLRPQYTQVYEISYKKQWGNGSAYITGFYRNISDIFSRVYTNDTASVYSIVNTIPANLGNGYNAGIELFLEEMFTPWFKANCSFSWYRNYINAFSGTHIYPYKQEFNFPETVTGTWNLKSNMSMSIPGWPEIQLTGVYYAPDIIPQGKVDSRYSVDFGISKKMKGDKIEIYLNANDIFNTFGLKTTIEGEGIIINKANYVETQVIMAGIKYKF